MSEVVRYRAAEQRLRELEYASDMLAEMQRMTKASGEKTLSYLIEMAYIEACDRRRNLHLEMKAGGKLHPIAVA